jgi:hypothetical protein
MQVVVDLVLIQDRTQDVLVGQEVTVVAVQVEQILMV